MNLYDSKMEYKATYQGGDSIFFDIDDEFHENFLNDSDSDKDIYIDLTIPVEKSSNIVLNGYADTIVGIYPTEKEQTVKFMYYGEISDDIIFEIQTHKLKHFLLFNHLFELLRIVYGKIKIEGITTSTIFKTCEIRKSARKEMIMKVSVKPYYWIPTQVRPWYIKQGVLWPSITPILFIENKDGKEIYKCYP